MMKVSAEFLTNNENIELLTDISQATVFKGKENNRVTWIDKMKRRGFNLPKTTTMRATSFHDTWGSFEGTIKNKAQIA